MNEITSGVAWSNTYSLGNEQIDNQHKMLFSLVSMLTAACADGSDKEKLSDTLRFLSRYTEQHFAFEETLQICANYPDYETHKKQHEELMNTVGELMDRYVKTGSSSELSRDVNRIVVKWLINHIQREDKKVGDFLRKRDPLHKKESFKKAG